MSKTKYERLSELMTEFSKKHNNAILIKSQRCPFPMQEFKSIGRHDRGKNGEPELIIIDYLDLIK